MPGIEIFSRRWNIASDDLFYPGLFELIGRSLWFGPQLAYYIEYQSDFQCADVDILHVYYVGFLGLMFLIILSQLFIVIISSRGTITNTRPRLRINTFLYLRSFLVLAEFIWSVIGTIWLAKVKWNACSKIINISVLSNIIFCWIAIIFLILVLFFLFDPISHLPDTDSKRNILYSRLKYLFCCCYCCLYTGNSRNSHYENSYKQISSILEMIFRGGNLTPSDVLAGIILLSNKEKDQFSREYNIHKKFKNKLTQTRTDLIPKWMNINEAAYYIKYAVATYSWPYYIYMHNFRGCKDLCCSLKVCCCCCLPKSASIENIDADGLARGMVIHGDTRSGRHLKAFKFLCKIEECDLVYGNFENDLFFVPFCILVDHFKKSVVITIRGTLSLRDVITDITAECGYFDIDELKHQPCHVGILKTADNILEKIKSSNLLDIAFRNNPNYQLLVTGHSLGAGTAVILSLKLRKDYPNVKCIAYSPPGGLISSSLAEYTKSFVMSVVLGDDIVPRLSLRSVHNLKADILKEIYNCQLPKYKIIWKYSISFVSDKNSLINLVDEIYDEASSGDEDSHLDELDSSLNSSTSQKLLLDNNLDQIIRDPNETRLTKATLKAISTEAKKSIQSARQIIKNETRIQIDEDPPIQSDQNAIKTFKASLMAYQQVKQMMQNVYETYPELQLPGNILYIYQIKSNLRKAGCGTRCKRLLCFCSSRVDELEFDSRWATREEFKKILITNRMFKDHFPNTVEDALRYFNSNQTHHAII